MSTSEEELRPPVSTGELGLGGDSFVRAGTSPLQRGTKPQLDAELGEDFFERQAREQAQAKGTRPFAGAALHSLTEGTVAKAEALIESLEPRVELLVHACRMARKPIPGVESIQLRHPVPPASQKILTYLARAIHMKAPLLQRVQVAIFRYHEAVEVVAKAREGLETGELEPGILEEIKLKFYYLTNYHEEFRIDPVLTQVFPPPKDAQRPTARAGTGPVSAADVAQARQALEMTFHQAQQVVNELAGHLAFFAKAIDLVDQGKTGNLTGLFSDAATKRLQACAKALKGDPLLLVKLKGDRKLYDELLARTKESYRTAQLEPLKEALDAFLRLRASWFQHPTLKDHLAPAPSPKRG